MKKKRKYTKKKTAVIITKDNCIHCVEAKKLLDIAKIKYKEQVYGIDILKEELMALVPHAKTVPQIFINNKYIGGKAELKEYLNKNVVNNTK